VPPGEQLVFQIFSVGYDTCGAHWKADFGDMISNGPFCVQNRMAAQSPHAKDIDIFFDSTTFSNPDKHMF